LYPTVSNGKLYTCFVNAAIFWIPFPGMNSSGTDSILPGSWLLKLSKVSHHTFANLQTRLAQET